LHKLKDEDIKRRSERSTPEDPMGSPSTQSTPRIVVETISTVNHLEDGYTWKKYGQKKVKGSQFMRNYFKCTCEGCPGTLNSL
jgi:hypothetical protein